MINFKEAVHDIQYGGAHVKVYHANKGEGFPKHEHIYSHAILCHAGVCVIRVEGKELVMDKNTKPVSLLPNQWHEIEALEDGTVYVIVFAEGKY